jgi:hypothetical protein
MKISFDRFEPLVIDKKHCRHRYQISTSTHPNHGYKIIQASCYNCNKTRVKIIGEEDGIKFMWDL